MTDIGLTHYLVLSAVVLACGVVTVLVKRNAIGILIGVELMLNAANINLVAFDHFAAADATLPRLDGTIFALFIVVLAAAEAAVALAIILNFYNSHATVDVDRARAMGG